VAIFHHIINPIAIKPKDGKPISQEKLTKDKNPHPNSNLRHLQPYRLVRSLEHVLPSLLANINLAHAVMFSCGISQHLLPKNHRQVPVAAGDLGRGVSY
jgi:hypothetical protein